jgi:predicted nucleic acid-binding protein
VTFAYFDTSALVKRYVRERGSAQLVSLIDRYDFLSSAITPVELISVLSRKTRDGELSAADFSLTLTRIGSERVRCELVEVDEGVLNRAEEVVQGTVAVRALDAIHIASLMMFEAAAGVRVSLITGDGRQRDAAEQMRLDVVWVG